MQVLKTSEVSICHLVYGEFLNKKKKKSAQYRALLNSSSPSDMEEFLASGLNDEELETIRAEIKMNYPADPIMGYKKYIAELWFNYRLIETRMRHMRVADSTSLPKVKAKLTKAISPSSADANDFHVLAHSIAHAFEEGHAPLALVHVDYRFFTRKTASVYSYIRRHYTVSPIEAVIRQNHYNLASSKEFSEMPF